MCVAGAKLPSTIFDENTGKLKVRDVKVEDEVRDNAGPSFGSNCSTSYGYYGYEEYCQYYEYYYDAYYDYDYAYGYWPDSVSQFDQAYVGRVAGAKPPGGMCMPIRDTAIINTEEYRNDPVLAFANLMNMDDEPFVAGADTPNAYRRTNASLAKSFFIEGILGCPDIIDYTKNPPSGEPGHVSGIPVGEIKAFWKYAPNPNPPYNWSWQRMHDRETITARADLMRYTADFCYSYYALGRSLTPWHTLERPGFSSDDPLSYFDPDRTYLNSCQPFARWRGKLNDPMNPRRNNPMYVPGAREIQWGAWENKPYTSFMEKQAGLAPVYQHPGRADWNQAEYLLSDQLKDSWEQIFNSVGGTLSPDDRYTITNRYNGRLIKDAFPNPFAGQRIGLPCVELRGGSLPPITNFPPPKVDPPTVNVFNSCFPETPPDSPGGGCNPAYLPMPTDINPPSFNEAPYY